MARQQRSWGSTRKQRPTLRLHEIRALVVGAENLNTLISSANLGWLRAEDARRSRSSPAPSLDVLWKKPHRIRRNATVPEQSWSTARIRTTLGCECCRDVLASTGAESRCQFPYLGRSKASVGAS